MNFFLLCVLIGSAVACGPAGYGNDAAILTNPTFTYTFYPPARWTFYGGVPPAGVAPNTATSYVGQATSQAAAQQNMKNDIDAAILMALRDLGVSASGYQWSTSGYTPLQCLVRADNGQAGWRAVGTCVPQIGAVTTTRTTADSDVGTDLIQKGTLRVSTTQMVTRAQWKQLSTRVWNILSNSYNVYFRSEITLN